MMVATLIVLGVLCFVAFTAILFRYESTPRIDRYMYGSFGLGVVLLLAGTMLASKHETEACHKRGGEMVDTGRIIPVTTYVMSGKTMIPITTWIHETECRVPTP